MKKEIILLKPTKTQLWELIKYHEVRIRMDKVMIELIELIGGVGSER